MKKITKIDLESTFTPWTLDTYQTFTFDRDEECILETEGGGYDNYEWDYNTDGYLDELAKNRIELLKDNILDDVILDVMPGKIHRPKIKVKL